MRRTRLFPFTLAIFFAALIAAPAWADDDSDSDSDHDAEPRVVWQFHYESDPAVPTFPPPSACSRAPFQANGYVEGELTHYRVRRDGKAMQRRHPRTAGYARACLQLTDFSFTPFASPVPIYWEVDIDGVGSVTASGVCLPSNNTVPVPGVVLGGCVMTVTSAPAGFAGGNLVESGVLFNPFGIPGFEKSSSFFTLHLFRAE